MTSLEALQTPEQDSGWIEHPGVDCPVYYLDVVDARFPDGRTITTEAWALLWANVCSYRVLHTPAPSSQGDAQ